MGTQRSNKGKTLCTYVHSEKMKNTDEEEHIW